MTPMPVAPRLPWYYSVPVLGWIARDLVHGTPDNFWYFLVIVATLLIVAVKTFGLVALGLTALTMVPVMFAVLITITLGN